MAARRVIADDMRTLMEPHGLGQPTDPGRAGSDNRELMKAILWIARHRKRFRQPVARPAGSIRQVEPGLQALSRVGEDRRFSSHVLSLIRQT